MKRIEITVGADGETRIETKGFAGPECKAASKPYEDAMGVTTSDTPTAEARLQAPAKNSKRQNQGH